MPIPGGTAPVHTVIRCPDPVPGRPRIYAGAIPPGSARYCPGRLLEAPDGVRDRAVRPDADKRPCPLTPGRKAMPGE